MSMEYTVKPEETGRKLRDVIRGSMGVSYNAMKSAKWNGRIRLNGEPAPANAEVRTGDTVTVEWAKEAPLYTPRRYSLSLEIPYRDNHMMIVVKPAPLASQSSRNHPDDSLENAVYTFLGCQENFVYRPVNRLDKGTGGLMAIALSAHAQYRLQKQLHTPEFRRRYLAMTDGIPQAREGLIELPIAKAPGATVKRIVSPEGKPCRTRYRVIAEAEGKALVLLELETGRTHQIRVHLSALGCPVRGDFLYGTEQPEEFPGRFALHSALLELTHPISGERIRAISIPEWAEGVTDSVLLMDFD